MAGLQVELLVLVLIYYTRITAQGDASSHQWLINAPLKVTGLTIKIWILHSYLTTT